MISEIVQHQIPSHLSLQPPEELNPMSSLEEKMHPNRRMIVFTLTKQSWKCIRTRPAAIPGFLATALLTAFLTIASAAGQLL